MARALGDVAPADDRTAGAARATVGDPRPRRAETLPRDVLAGVTVALVLVPQALAYAGVAGMPPVVGLYAAALPPLAAAFFASSPYLQTGPVALTSLLTFGALAARAPVASEAYVELGVMLALIVGVIRVLVGVLRAGGMAYLMSEPMLMGFVPAGAILIVASQLPAALGAASSDRGILAGAASAAADPGDWQWAAIALTVATLAIVLGGRRLHRFFPGVLVALVAGLLLSDAGTVSVATVGAVPAGLPPLPALPFEELPSLLLPGAVIALVGFAEPASIARTFATRERQPWSADREFVSQGVANLAAGISSGYPVGGSLSRTALNHMAGAATRLSGAVTGLVVLAFLPFASVLEPLPKAVLGAIVISAVIGLVRLRRLLLLWPVSKPQFAVAWTTFGLTLALAPHVEHAVLIGIALSIAVHLVRELRVEVDATVLGSTLEIRPSGVLWFGTAQALEERLIGLLDGHRGVTRVRLSLDGLGRIDLTGAIALDQLVEDAREAGLEVEVRGVPPQASGLFERFAARGRALR
jgi:SulP family sulfate permease